MNSYYPPGVTGNEPQIIGTGMEDKCDRCLEQADEHTEYVPDGIIEIGDEWLCLDCAKEVQV